MRVKRLVVLFAITVMYAPSAAAPCTEDARSRAEAMPVRIAAGRCDKADEGPIGGGSQSRRSSGLPPRRRHLDRGTAPVALTAARPQGWWGFVSRSQASGLPQRVSSLLLSRVSPTSIRHRSCEEGH